MSIKNSTIITISALFLLFLVVIAIFTDLVISNSFKDMETQTILNKLAVMRNTLDQQHISLEVTVRDWAYWDDMRDYMLDHNPRFIQSNFAESIFENYHIHIAAIIDTNFKTIYGVTYESDPPALLNIQSIIDSHLKTLAPNLKLLDANGAERVLLHGVYGPIMLAFVPILDSNAEGPIMGYFMMGRYLDEDYIEQLSTFKGFDVQVTDLTDIRDSTTNELIADTINGRRVKFPGHNLITATDLIKDVNGRNLFLVKAQSQMEATSIGRKMRDLMLIAYILMGTILVISLRLSIHRRVLDRLLDLQKGVKRVSSNPSGEELLQISGNDELTALTQDVNSMLTALWNAQHELESAKIKAEESDKLKSAFLSTISHELRTPLNHIMGFSQLLSNQIKDSELKDFARQIYNSGESLLKTIQDIINLAFTEHAMIKASPKAIQAFDHFFRNKSTLEDILRTAGKEKDISLIFNPDPTLLMKELYLDAGKVNQILHKLFINAVKFTERGSIEFSLNLTENGLLRYMVKDSGIGIAEEKQHFIFNLFRQSDEGTSRSFTGVGIGLAIAKRFTEVLNGKLSVESTLGKGSIFYLDIPYEEVKKQKPSSKEAAELQVPNLEGIKVLLLEPDDTGRIITENLLSRTEAAVQSFSDPNETRQILEQTSKLGWLIYPLEYCDSEFPELVQSLRLASPDLKIIITGTELSHPEWIHQISQAQYLVKPLTRKILYNALG
ncbi:MAG: CHASE4 domain-containing protein [Candidatus Cloacimonetes bacterium]|nr:CHASE4 domain-containing protein [Candidatus Cloacimonadota bacterium]